MFADQFATATAAARTQAQLDNISRLVWRGHADGHLSDADAEAAAEAVQARRKVLGISIPAKPAAAPVRPRQAPRSPDRQASLERRRRWVASGALPPQIAAAFTMGEQAALAVVARQVQQHGQCRLPLDQLAALAGVSRSSMKNAIRTAKHLGLIDVVERRRAGQPSLPNVVSIIAPSWRAWLRIGGRGAGVKNLTSTITRNLIKTEKDVLAVDKDQTTEARAAASGISSHELLYCSSVKAEDGSSKWMITEAAISV